MTTPLENLDGLLPFAIRYKMGTGAYMVPEAGQRATGEFYTPPAGVYQIQLAYTGPEAAEVWWLPAGPGTVAIKMCQIPADKSGAPRSARPQTIQANGVGQLSITTTPRPNGGAQSTSTASLHIYPLPQ